MIGLLITVFRVLPIAKLLPEQPNNYLVAGNCFESIEPSNGKAWASVPEATADNVNYSVKAAERVMYEDLKEMGHDVDNPAGV